MAIDPTGGRLGRLVARLTRRRPNAPDPLAAPRDERLPEQRLIDASERYARIVSGDGVARRHNDAASAGVRTVPPRDVAEAGAPVWVRRLGDPNAGGASPVETVAPDADPGRTGSAPRRGRRRD